MIEPSIVVGRCAFEPVDEDFGRAEFLHGPINFVHPFVLSFLYMLYIGSGTTFTFIIALCIGGDLIGLKCMVSWLGTCTFIVNPICVIGFTILKFDPSPSFASSAVYFTESLWLP